VWGARFGGRGALREPLVRSLTSLEHASIKNLEQPPTHSSVSHATPPSIRPPPRHFQALSAPCEPREASLPSLGLPRATPAPRHRSCSSQGDTNGPHTTNLPA